MIGERVWKQLHAKVLPWVAELFEAYGVQTDTRIAKDIQNGALSDVG